MTSRRADTPVQGPPSHQAPAPGPQTPPGPSGRQGPGGTAPAGHGGRPPCPKQHAQACTRTHRFHRRSCVHAPGTRTCSHAPMRTAPSRQAPALCTKCTMCTCVFTGTHTHADAVRTQHSPTHADRASCPRAQRPNGGTHIPHIPMWT